MRQCQPRRAAAIRSVQDQIEIDDTRCVARRATAAEARFDFLQLVEQILGRQARVTEDHRVEKLWRRRIDRLGLDDRAHSDDRNHPPQLLDRSKQIPAAIAEIRAEGNDDGAIRR